MTGSPGRSAGGRARGRVGRQWAGRRGTARRRDGRIVVGCHGTVRSVFDRREKWGSPSVLEARGSGAPIPMVVETVDSGLDPSGSGVRLPPVHDPRRRGRIAGSRRGEVARRAGRSDHERRDPPAGGIDPRRRPRGGGGGAAVPRRAVPRTGRRRGGRGAGSSPSVGRRPACPRPVRRGSDRGRRIDPSLRVPRRSSSARSRHRNARAGGRRGFRSLRTVAIRERTRAGDLSIIGSMTGWIHAD